jgi:hypothetical protein
VWAIELENQGYALSFGTPSADPYLARTLPRMGALLENYYAIGHSRAANALRIGHLDGDYHDPRCAWQRHRQIASDGAIVVRQDWFIAWRSPAAASNPRAVLTAALSQILGRRPFAQPGSAGS